MMSRSKGRVALTLESSALAMSHKEQFGPENSVNRAILPMLEAINSFANCDGEERSLDRRVLLGPGY